MKKFGKNQHGKKVRRYYARRPRTGLGNMPKFWSYDEATSKLYLFFEREGVKYLIKLKAMLSSDLSGCSYGVLGNGTEYVLLNSSRKPFNQILAAA